MGKSVMKKCPGAFVWGRNVHVEIPDEEMSGCICLG